MNTHFKQLTEPTLKLVEVFNHWENDKTLIPLIHPIQNKLELEDRKNMSLNDLNKLLESHKVFLIYLDDQLIGEMNFMIDPSHLYKKEPGTAWIGITIGESVGRGKGIGYTAIQYLEEQIKKQGLKRIELGVFEFNKAAHRLYQKLGYQEIGRIENFTYWQGKMWTDIRMEKYI